MFADLWHPSIYPTTNILLSLRAFPVQNEHGWDITCVVIYTLNYSDHKGKGKETKGFDNRNGDINAVKLYFSTSKVGIATLDRNKDGVLEIRDVKADEKDADAYNTERWHLQWWSLSPMSFMASETGLNDEDYAMPIPEGLEAKLLSATDRKNNPHTCEADPREEEEREEEEGIWAGGAGEPFISPHKRIGPWNALQIWAAAALVVSVVVVVYCGTRLLVMAIAQAVCEALDSRKGPLNLDDYAFLKEEIEETEKYESKSGI